MKYLNKFFGRNKYQVDDDELVWKREDSNEGYNIYQLNTPVQPEYTDMVLPKSYTSNITPHPLENPKDEYRQNMVNVKNNEVKNVNPYKMNMPKSRSPIREASPFIVNDKYEQFNTEIIPPNIQQNREFNFNNPSRYNNRQKQLYYVNGKNNNFFSPDRQSNNEKSITPDQTYVEKLYNRNTQKHKTIKPELRDYYKIEENIMKKMMQSKESDRNATKNKSVDVFSRNAKLPTPKHRNQSREGVRKNNNPPLLAKKTPQEVKIHRGLVFKTVDDNDKSHTNETKPPQTSEIAESEIQYVGKSMNELQAILKERYSRMARLEQRNNQLMSNGNNVLTIKKQVQEVDQEIEKLNEKNMHLETEQRLLQEDFTTKKDTLNDLETTLTKIPEIQVPDAQAKKDLINNIEKSQQHINDLERKLLAYDDGKSKEIEDIKKNSEKNMQMEIEEIKINMMNYDEELLRWLQYFEAKVSKAINSNGLNQNIF